MKYIPENDGVDHINIYSKGKTELGRLLSNFAYTPFTIPDKGSFNTVEGFWYWTMTGLSEFRKLPGWECKKIGDHTTPLREHPNEEELLEAYLSKINNNPSIAVMLAENELPFAHYYVYGGKVIEPKQWQWTAQLWNRVRETLK